MEMTTGRVLTQATIENLGDLFHVERGRAPWPARCWRVTGEEALVDTVATTLALPARLICSLGLNKIYENRAGPRPSRRLRFPAGASSLPV